MTWTLALMTLVKIMRSIHHCPLQLDEEWTSKFIHVALKSVCNKRYTLQSSAYGEILNKLKLSTVSATRRQWLTVQCTLPSPKHRHRDRFFNIILRSPNFINVAQLIRGVLHNNNYCSSHNVISSRRFNCNCRIYVFRFFQYACQ